MQHDQDFGDTYLCETSKRLTPHVAANESVTELLESDGLNSMASMCLF